MRRDICRIVGDRGEFDHQSGERHPLLLSILQDIPYASEEAPKEMASAWPILPNGMNRNLCPAARLEESGFMRLVSALRAFPVTLFEIRQIAWRQS